MISIKDLYSILAHQETPEEMGKTELQRHLDECWKYSKQIEENPNNIHAYVTRAIVRLELGMPEEALKDCETAIKLDPTYAMLYELCGRAKGAMGKLEEEMQCYDESIKLDPKRNGAFYHRGKAKYHRKMFKEAIEDFDEVIKISPNYVHAYNYRAYAKIRIKDLKEGIADFDKLIEILSESKGITPDAYACLLNAYSTRSQAKKDLGDHEGAKEDLEKRQIMKSNEAENLQKSEEIRKKYMEDMLKRIGWTDKNTEEKGVFLIWEQEQEQ